MGQNQTTSELQVIVNLFPAMPGFNFGCICLKYIRIYIYIYINKDIVGG